MDRRSFLRRTSVPTASLLMAPALAPFALAARSPPAALHGARDDAALDFTDFLELARSTVGELAAELLADRSPAAESRYLHALAACAVRLRDAPVPELRDTTADPATTARTWLGANEGDVPFTLLHWKLDPGAIIRPHAHTYGNVVTLCLEGEVRVENWEAVEAPLFDSPAPIVARRVVVQQLLPGAVNLVPLHRGYVHGFVAGPSGARGLDLTTRIAPKRWNPLLHVEGEPIDAARGHYRARWSLA